MPNPILIKRLSKAAIFTPQNLSGLAGWWKADSLNVANNSGIGVSNTWVDSSGNGKNWTTNPNTNPIFQTNQVGSLPGVKFQNGNTSIGGPSFTLTDFTFMLVYTSAAGADGCILGNQSVNRQFRINRVAANVCQFFDGTTEAISATFGTSITSRRCVTWRRSGTAVDFYENATARTGGTSGGSTVINMMGQSSAIFFNGLVFEAAMYSSALTNAQILSLYNGYFKSKWSLP